MKRLFQLTLTFLLLTGCRAEQGSGDQGGSSSASSSSRGGSSSSASKSSSSLVSSGGSGGTSSSDSGGATSSSSASSGGEAGSGGSSSSSSATGGSSGSGGSSQASAGSSGGAGGTSAAGGSAGKGGSGGGASGGAGSTGSGGTGSGGTTASSTATYSTAPTQCSFPSNWTPGQATYTTYTMPNAISGCGYNVSNNQVKNIVTPANFAAIPGKSSSDFDTSNRCGACIQIGSAIITIVDECPYDGNNNPPCKANPTGHMDISNAAAGAGNVKGDPNVRGQTQWKYVPCPVNGNVIARLKSGNSNEIFIENEILPIAAVTCNGQTASRTSYGAWHFGANVPGATCEVTDIAGRKIGITLGSTQGQDVDTKVQFPKCL